VGGGRAGAGGGGGAAAGGGGAARGGGGAAGAGGLRNARRPGRRGASMDLPKISIVTPSYNQRRFLGWTMRSVLLQRYPNLEYIVMDGGSTDGSAEYIASVGDRLAHWQSAPDGGQAAAVRAGLDRSTGEICAWLNSDDMLAPGALQFVAEYFRRNPEVDMVYSNRVFVDENNRV